MRKHLKDFFIVTYFLVFPFIGKANQSPLDSLKLALKNAKNDSLKCYYLDKVIEQELNPKLCVLYNDQLTIIAEKNCRFNNPNNIQFYKTYLSHAYNNSGILASESGNFKLANSYYSKSLKLREEVGNDKFVIMTLLDISVMYMAQGKIKESLQYITKGLKLAERTNNKIAIGNFYNELGSIYETQGNRQKALEYYNKLLSNSIAIGNKRGEATALNNISFCYSWKDSAKTVMKHLTRCRQIYEEINEVESAAQVYANIAFLLYQQGKMDQSLEYFKKSLKIQEGLNNKQGMATVLARMGNAYLEQNDKKKAFECIEQALIYARESGNPEIVCKVAEHSKIFYLKNNMPAKALDMYELYITMRDSIVTQGNRDETLKAEMNYEFDKKELILRQEHEKQQLLSESKAKQQKWIIWSVVFGLLILTFFSIFIYKRLQITKQQKAIIEEQKVIVENQKEIVEEKQKEIFESIHYAKRIQTALIANKEMLTQNLKNHFVLFKPKDIVSGDFYWATEHDGNFYVAVCDSTGHGVPGAFMSLLNMGFLSEAIKEKNIQDPNEILNFVRNRLINTIGKEGQQDGMDAILLRKNQSTKKLSYAAANNAPVLISGGQIVELPKDKMPVGKGEKMESFNLFNIDAKEGDVLYLYTDGYADQFGGGKGKKFRYKPLNELLLSSSSIDDLQKLEDLLEKHFNDWKGDLEQVDDVCVIGIKI